MLSRIDAYRTAIALVDRFGDVAVAAAVLRAQQANREGRNLAMVDWCRIAAAAASHAGLTAGQGGSVLPTPRKCI